MAVRTFKADGTSRAWSLTTTWVEGIVPTAADDVVFSTNVASSILVIDGTSVSPSLCRSIDTTNYTKTITFATGKQLNVGTSTSGAFKMTAGMTFVAAGLIKFVSTTTGNNITWAGYQSQTDGITFDGVGGGWQLQDAMASGNNAVTVTLTNGALDLNSQSVTGFKFSSNNSNTRSLTMGTTTWACNANANGLVWDIGTATGMTLSAASSTITASGITTVASTFAGGGLTYGTVSITTPTTATMSWTGANTFGTLTMSMGATTKLVASGYSLSANQTVTGTFTANGNSAILRNLIASDTRGTNRTITAATVSATHTDFRNITGAGAGSWDFSGLTSTANGNAGGNSGITFTAPKNCFMKTAVSVNWSGSNWFTASGGSTGITPAVPLIHDTAMFDGSSVTAGSVTITNSDQPRIPAMNWTSVTNTPAFASGASAWESYGSITLVSGMTHTGAGTMTFAGGSSYTFNGGTLTWPASSTLIVNNGSGTITLAANITSSAGVTITGGAFAQGGFTANVTALNVNGGTWSGTGAITGTTCTVAGGTFTLGGTLTLTGALAVSSGTLEMNSQNITGHTTTAISGTGVLNLSGQSNGSGAITVTAGTVSDTGASGELKGTTSAFSGGTSTMRKLTCSSTWSMTGGTTTISASGSASYSAFPSLSSPAIFATGGAITSMTNTALTVAAAGGGSGMLYIQALDGA